MVISLLAQHNANLMFYSCKAMSHRKFTSVEQYILIERATRFFISTNTTKTI
jgi:hypothetical protein